MGSISKALKAATGNAGDDSVQASKAIAGKGQMINEYVQATKPAAAVPAKAPADNGSASSDKINPKAQYGDRKGEKRIDVSGMTKPLGLSKGAKIKKSRVVRVHAGEVVVPRGRAKSKKMSKSGLAKGLQSVY